MRFQKNNRKKLQKIRIPGYTPFNTTLRRRPPLSRKNPVLFPAHQHPGPSAHAMNAQTAIHRAPDFVGPAKPVLEDTKSISHHPQAPSSPSRSSGHWRLESGDHQHPVARRYRS